MKEYKAPHSEPDGHRAQIGFVKNNPLNNDYYINQLEGGVWYPAVLEAHKTLYERFPGYNIVQIKEKFGELRFYVSKGSCPDDIWNMKEANDIIRVAEQAVAELTDNN